MSLVGVLPVRIGISLERMLSYNSYGSECSGLFSGERSTYAHGVKKGNIGGMGLCFSNFCERKQCLIPLMDFVN